MAKRRVSEIEDALLRKRSEQESFVHKKDILNAFNNAFAKTQRDRHKLEFLFRYFDVIDSEESFQKNLGEVLIAFEQLVANFKALVFPHRKEDNFFLKSTSLTTSKFFDIYTTPPRNVVDFVTKKYGEEYLEYLFEDERSRETVYIDIDLWVNGLLLRLMRCIHGNVYVSGFFNSFSLNVKAWLIGGWCCLISRDFVTGKLCVETPEPFSVAIERTSTGGVVGIYRKLSIPYKDIFLYYPDYKGKVVSKDPDENFDFKECLRRQVVKRRDGSFYVFWQYCVFDRDDNIVVIREMPLHTYMVFSDRFTAKSPNGRGRMYYLYEAIKLADQQQAWLNNNVFSSVQPPRTINVELLAPLPGVVSKDGYVQTVRRIKNNEVIPVRQHGLIADILPPDDSRLRQSLMELKAFIIRSISGEFVNNDPSTTATLSRIQDNVRANFAQSLGSSAVEDFMWQLVRTFSVLLKANGSFFDELYNYMRLPEVKMPLWYSKLKSMAEENQDEEGLRFADNVLIELIERILDALGDFTGFELEVNSPVEIAKSAEKAQMTLQGVAQMAQLLQTSPFDFVNVDKFLNYYAKSLGIDTDLLLSKKEREEVLMEKIKAQQAQ